MQESCRKLSFLRKIGTEESTLSASILRSLATEDILNVSLVWQCLKLEKNFTMPICEAILKSPEAESIPDPTRELLKKDFTYILTIVYTVLPLDNFITCVNIHNYEHFGRKGL